MAEIGGMLAAAVVKAAYGKVVAAAGDGVTRQLRFSKDLAYMRDALESIVALLEDAERRSVEEASVRLWLKRLTTASYDISDILDEFEVDAARRSALRKLKVLNLCLTAAAKVSTADKMREVRERLENISKQHQQFIFTIGNNSYAQQVTDERETSSEVIEEDILGRDQEKQKLMTLLTQASPSSEFIILPIYGMGGIGKTTLAKLLFNDTHFKDYKKAWVYVSPTFDSNKVGDSVRSQLQNNQSQLTDTQESDDDPPALKKILIVLDDLWENDDFKVGNLKNSLKMFCSNGQKVHVIVTTRDAGIAQKIQTSEAYAIEPLSSDTCWMIIKQQVVGFEDRPDKQRLEDIGKEIAIKCKGVALAARALGYILRFRNFDGWVSVNDNEIWNIPMAGHTPSPYDNVLASLKLSYISMLPYLRPCFAYCAIFPKGHKIAKDDLIYQWVALGFIIKSSNEDYTWLQHGESIINQLLGMSFLQHSKSPSERLHSPSRSLARRSPYLCPSPPSRPQDSKMVGGLRNVTSLYRRARGSRDDEEPSASARGRGKGKPKGRGRGKGKARPETPPESEDEVPPAVVEEESSSSSDDDGPVASGEASASTAKLWSRGPSQLPRRPIPIAHRPLVRPAEGRSWETLEVGASHTRKVNGILGLLCRQHFPGLVVHHGTEEPAVTFSHYYDAEDQDDRQGRNFGNKAMRVIGELWDFFRCAPGHEAAANELARVVCCKLVTDMVYEARVQAVIDYWKTQRVKHDKKAARTIYLTHDQYVAAIPWWCAAHPDAWGRWVTWWCSPEWMEAHLAARERRFQMTGPAHHQGSVPLPEYIRRWESAHPGQELTQFQAIAVSHMGRATSDVHYNPEAGPEAYSNPMVHARLTTYSEMGRQKHGPEWDPARAPVDGEVVMRMAGGKRHGRYAIGNSTIDTASTPSLSQIRAGSANPDIRQPQTASGFNMQLIQAQLEEERKRTSILEARLDEERRARQEDQRQRDEAERLRHQQMVDWHNWLISTAKDMGRTPPPMTFVPQPLILPPPQSSPNFARSAAASNEAPAADEDLAHQLARDFFDPAPPSQ